MTECSFCTTLLLEEDNRSNCKICATFETLGCWQSPDPSRYLHSLHNFNNGHVNSACKYLHICAGSKMYQCNLDVMKAL
jgi:hypothetical protein